MNFQSIPKIWSEFTELHQTPLSHLHFHSSHLSTSTPKIDTTQQNHKKLPILRHIFWGQTQDFLEKRTFHQGLFLIFFWIYQKKLIKEDKKKEKVRKKIVCGCALWPGTSGFWGEFPIVDELIWPKTIPWRPPCGLPGIWPTTNLFRNEKYRWW